MMEVLRPGLLCTVQDLGRDGLSHWGISPGGAADPLLLRAGNLLAGNPEGAAAVEITGWGGTYRFDHETLVSVCGDFPVRIDGHDVRAFESLRLASGAELHIGHSWRGFRGYLCIAGGVLAPLLWGSRSNYLPGKLGGWHGRALRAGDRLPLGPSPEQTLLPRKAATWLASSLPATECLLRVTPGPHAPLFPSDAFDRLCATTWRVLPESNRMGLRLRPEDPRSTALLSPSGSILSEGVPAGAVQFTPSGEPIVLGVDSQTTGGYAVLASVISADRRSIGQLPPGCRVRFAIVSLEEARQHLMELEAAFYHWKEGL